MRIAPTVPNEQRGKEKFHYFVTSTCHIHCISRLLEVSAAHPIYCPGGVLDISLGGKVRPGRVGRCGPAPHTLTLFKTNITAIFDTLFKTFKVAVTRNCVAFLLCNQWKFNVPGMNTTVNINQY